MEPAVCTGLQSVSSASLCPLSSKFFFDRRFFDGLQWSRKLSNCGNTKRTLGLILSSARDGPLKEVAKSDAVNSLDEIEFVHVIGIGSMKDAVVDFCLDSPFQLSSLLRFWNIHVKDMLNVQLQERFLRKDLNPSFVEASQFVQTCSKAIVLVCG